MKIKEPEKIAIPGITFFIKIPSSETNNQVAIFEEMTDPGVGPALHYHEDQTEIFRILSGKYLMQVGNKNFIAQAGNIVRIPPMTPHTFLNIGKVEASLEFIFLPGNGIENFFRELPNVIFSKDDFHKIGQIGSKYGTIALGPPLKLS